MRINFDRLSKLAGIPASSNRGNLREGKNHDDHSEEMDEMVEMEEMDEMVEMEEDMYEDSAISGLEEEMDEMDEEIEVDEAMLVQELRRAKRIMQESRRVQSSAQRKQKIFERQLKKVIDEEVQNVMDEMSLNSQWVYGDNRPQRSRKGYTHQGSILPGLGFKK
tara:strand:+ start:491 stop:982 length:492 start_codon:yes stop_codon:yes gene_type:complete